jgi:hypothetical protein
MPFAELKLINGWSFIVSDNDSCALLILQAQIIKRRIKNLIGKRDKVIENREIGC